MKLFLFLTPILICSCRNPSTANQQETAETKSMYDTIIVTECNYNNLSAQFNVSICYYEFSNKKEQTIDSCMAKINLIDKKNKSALCEIKVSSITAFIRDDSTNDYCTQVLSYSTRYNLDKDVSEGFDSYYGNVVVADFNFDKKDDVAVLGEICANTIRYIFYLQNSEGKMVYDRFLTDTVSFFPAINTKNNTLKTNYHLSAASYGESIFQYNAKTNSFKQTRDTIIVYE